MKLAFARMEGSFATVSVTGMVCEAFPDATPGAGATTTDPEYVPGNRPAMLATVTVKGVPVVVVVGETESQGPPETVVAETVIGIWLAAGALGNTAVDCAVMLCEGGGLPLENS